MFAVSFLHPETEPWLGFGVGRFVNLFPEKAL